MCLIYQQTRTSLQLLQERSERRAREDSERLLEGLNVVVSGALAKLEIFKCEITALVQVCVLVGQLLELTHHCLHLSLSLDLVALSLGLCLRLICNVLVLGLDSSVCLLNEGFIVCLCVLFS